MLLRKLLQAAFLWFLMFSFEAFGQVNPTLASLGDNTVRDLGTMSCTTPNGDTQPCNNVSTYSGAEMNPNTGKPLMFGGGHSTTFTDSVFEFSFSTLAWVEKYAPTPGSSMSQSNFEVTRAVWLSGPSGPYPRRVSMHSYDMLSFAANTNELVVLYGPNGGGTALPPDAQSCSGGPWCPDNPAARIAHYRLSANDWTFSASNLGGSTGSGIPASEYDPVSGKIIVFGSDGLWIYDPVTKTSVHTQSVLDRGGSGHMVYFPPNQKMYYFNRDGGVWELTLNRSNLPASTFTLLSTTGTQSPHPEPGYAYDVANQVIVGGLLNNRFYIFDPTTRIWTNQLIQGGAPDDMAFHTITYNSANNVFIFQSAIIDSEGRINPNGKVWAYRYKNAASSPADTTPPSSPMELKISN